MPLRPGSMSALLWWLFLPVMPLSELHLLKMPPKPPSTEHLLLLLASITLLGVLVLTALQTIIAGYSLDAHLRENVYGIVFAAMVTIVCVLEMIGWNWDRGYLDRIIEWLNAMMGRKPEETDEFEQSFYDEKMGFV